MGPWKYWGSVVFTTGLIGVGFLLQLAIGPLNVTWPVVSTGYLGVAVLIILVLVGLAKPNLPLVKWLASPRLATCLLTSLSGLGLIMGLVPQSNLTYSGEELWLKLGLTTMTSAWPFGLIYLATLMSLAVVTGRRLRPLSRRNVIFILNHLGLGLLMVAAGLGASDRQRLIMSVREGQVADQAYNNRQEIQKLPLTIKLQNFYLEEYPPKLVVIDLISGQPQAKSRTPWLPLEPNLTEGQIDDWILKVRAFLPQAKPDGETYLASTTPDSAPAAQVAVINQGTKEMALGWVSAGHETRPPQILPLNEQEALAITRPEPKQFRSKIKITTQTGQEAEATVAVNQPAKVDNWMIYQHSYTQATGKTPALSGFELVHDPWLPVAHLGLWMMALGALGLIWSGRSRPPQKPTQPGVCP